MQEHRHLAFSLARVTPALVLMMLVGAAAVFFLLPRMSAGYLGGYSFGTDLSTGFSDRVQLGQIGQIQQSDAVVMHIQIDGDRHGQIRPALARRGAGKLSTARTGRTRASRGLQREPDGSFRRPLLQSRSGQGCCGRGQTAPGRLNHLIHYRVLMEPIGTNVFFLAPWARRVSGAYRSLQIDAGGAVSDVDSERSVSTVRGGFRYLSSFARATSTGRRFSSAACPGRSATAGARPANPAAGGADHWPRFQQLRPGGPA